MMISEGQTIFFCEMEHYDSDFAVFEREDQMIKFKDRIKTTQRCKVKLGEHGKFIELQDGVKIIIEEIARLQKEHIDTSLN